MEVGFDEWDEISNATTNWLSGVSLSGNFLCPNELSTIVGSSNIPSGWNISHSDYLKFTAAEASATIAMSCMPNAPSVHLQYSFDKIKWEPFVVGETSVVLSNEGDYMYLVATDEGNQQFCYRKSSSDY